MGEGLETRLGSSEKTTLKDLRTVYTLEELPPNMEIFMYNQPCNYFCEDAGGRHSLNGDF